METTATRLTQHLDWYSESHGKIDGVSPVDSRPSIDYLHNYLIFFTHDTRQVKCDRWHVTCDIWHMTHDMWWEVNNLSKLKPSSFYNFGVKAFWRCCGKGSVRKAIFRWNEINRSWYRFAISDKTWNILDFRMTGDKWHVKRNVTHDIWHVICAGKWTISKNVSSLAFIILEWRHFEDFVEKYQWGKGRLKKNAALIWVFSKPGLTPPPNVSLFASQVIFDLLF